jgi:hypothetical protein
MLKYKKGGYFMPNKLKNVKINYLSLVKKGANKKEIIFKSADSFYNLNRDIKIKKSDSKKGLVYGIVYSPLVEDTQGDFATAEEIEKMAYDFMKNKKTTNVDVGHNEEIANAFVCESWIIQKEDHFFKDEPEGSWAVAIKVEDENLKKAIEEGDITGISMAGVADREEVSSIQKEISKADIFSIIRDLIENGWMSLNLSGDLKKKDNVSKEEQVLTKEEIAIEIAKAVENVKKQIEPLKEENKKLKKEYQELLEELNPSQQILPPHKILKEDNTTDWEAY